MEILIIEGTDITPLLSMDWMKTLKLTVGRTQLAEINESEKEKIFKQISGLVRKQRNYKRHRNKNATKTRKIPDKTKNPPGTITPTRRCRKRTRKTNYIRTPRVNRRRGRRKNIFISRPIFQAERNTQKEPANTKGEINPKNRHCLRGLDDKHGRWYEILRDILDGKLKIVQKRKSTGRDTEKQDEYDDDEEMPEETEH